MAHNTQNKLYTASMREAMREAQEKRLHLINMRECLRQVQNKLPPSANGQRFICHLVEDTDCSYETKQATRNYVQRALNGTYTFESCMEQLNSGRRFGSRMIMDLRRKFIDILCDRINVELTKLGGLR